MRSVECQRHNFESTSSLFLFVYAAAVVEGVEERGKSRTWTDHRQVNQLGISTHVVYSSNSVRASFKCHSVCGAANSRLDIAIGSDAYAALAWRELFLNSCRGTPNDFLLNYAAALTF